MTPKEKAKDLFNKIGKSISKPQKSGGSRFNIQMCKQCALIAVDEIIDTFIPKTKPDFTCYEIEYWKEVKQEIENL